MPGQAKWRINSLWRDEEKRVFVQTAYFFLPLSLCLSSLSARQLRYCLYGDYKGARPDHSARPQTTAHLEWSRRVFKLYPLAPLLFPPLNSTMPPFSLWAALHEPETTSLHTPAAQILKKQMCCSFFRRDAYIKVFDENKLQWSAIMHSKKKILILPNHSHATVCFCEIQMFLFFLHKATVYSHHVFEAPKSTTKLVYITCVPLFKSSEDVCLCGEKSEI